MSTPSLNEPSHVGVRKVPEPFDQLRHFLALEAVFAFERGESEIREPVGIGRDGKPAHELHDRAGVEQPVDEARRMAEEGQDLLQVHVHAAVEDAPLAHVRLVG